MIDKQLIEAAKNYAKIPLYKDVDTEERYFNDAVREYDAFMDGAEWAADKLYTEEDVYKILIDHTLYNSGFGERVSLSEWFNKYKKK